MYPDDVQRWALGIEYDGSAFRGWQVQQPGVRSVQQVLENALGSVADHALSVTCAGRTDAGVHAVAQVVHFDSPARRGARTWVLGTNSRLPGDVRVQWAIPVDGRFHARYTALSRRYRYVVLNAAVPSALLRGRVAAFRRPLDATLMADVAQCLVGEHDFSAFRAVGCQSRSPVRHLQELRVWRSGPLVAVEVQANAFLHHMVRNIAGVLMAVGAGDRPPAWVQEVLAGRDRTRAGITAPASGLYLVAVRYPDPWQFPESVSWAIPGAGPRP